MERKRDLTSVEYNAYGITLYQEPEGVIDLHLVFRGDVIDSEAYLSLNDAYELQNKLENYIERMEREVYENENCLPLGDPDG